MSDDMNDGWNPGDLGALAPEVDLAASRELFARRRARSRGRRAALAVAAASVVLAGAVGALLASADRDRQVTADGDEASTTTEASATSDTAEAGSPPFTVVETFEDGLTPMGTLLAATDRDQLEELWAAVRPGYSQHPEIDLDEYLVVSITIPDDACPPTLTSFERNGSELTPIFVEPDGGCRAPLIPKTFVVAIDRASVTPEFTLVLPGQPTYGFDEQRLDIEVSPSTSGSEQGPARDADAFGTLSDGEGGALTLDVDPRSDDYYQGTTVIARDGPSTSITFLGPNGRPLPDHPTLQAGMKVAVWFRGGCLESYPVQCDVDRVMLTE